MFDFDAGKLIIVGIVALIVIGPELPRVMLQVGQAAAKMRHMAAEFRSQFMDAMREAEIDDINSDVERLMEAAKAGTGMNPLAQIKAELTQAIDSAEKPAMLPSASTRTAIAGPNNATSTSRSSWPPPPKARFGRRDRVDAQHASFQILSRNTSEPAPPSMVGPALRSTRLCNDR